MYLIKDQITNEIIINKSRFLTTIIRINSIDEVNESLALIRKKYYDANHNCYAYILGDMQEIQKCNDDGEPSKTAGYPILEVLKKQKLTNVLAIVTRYFGGIMLGAGGLIRAYSNSVSTALKNVVYYYKKSFNVYSLAVDYPVYNNLLKFLENKIIINNSFTTNVLLTIALEKDKSLDLLNTINDLTNGQALIIYLGENHLETPCENT